MKKAKKHILAAFFALIASFCAIFLGCANVHVKNTALICDDCIACSVDKSEFFPRTVSVNGVDKREFFPRGVSVCGVDVSGMEKNAAFFLVRQEERLRIPEFYVRAAKKTVVFQPYEIGFYDDLENIFISAKSGNSYESTMVCYLKEGGIDRLIGEMEERCEDARVSFDKNGFSYQSEKNGVSVDREIVTSIVSSALNNMRFGERGYEFPVADATKACKKTKARFTLKDALSYTKKISSFTTNYQTSSEGRRKNIALASAALDGYTIEAKETLSFNEVVGERTAARGYSEAKIISGGEFVDGVGGGVCQVSTTLFNAALLAGLQVKERRAHSLAVSYVSPSRDAMVSETSDLKIYNSFEYPVYLSAKTNNGSLVFSFYGKRQKRTYSLHSEVTGYVEPPEEEIKTLDREESAAYPENGESVCLRAPRRGVKSVLYRNVCEDGKLIFREELFKDAYAPVRGITGVLTKKMNEKKSNAKDAKN